MAPKIAGISLHDFTISTTPVVAREKESRPVGWYRSGQACGDTQLTGPMRSRFPWAKQTKGRQRIQTKHQASRPSVSLKFIDVVFREVGMRK